MDYTPFLSENKGENVCPSTQMHSLYEVCQQIKDGRKARGKHYEFAGLLLLLILAKLTGVSSLLAGGE